MHVEVGDRQPLQSVRGERMGGSHRDVVEQAETHRLVAGGMVAGRTHRTERTSCGAAEHRVDCRHDGSGRAQGGLGRTG